MCDISMDSNFNRLANVWATDALRVFFSSQKLAEYKFRDKWPLVCIESINMPKKIVKAHIHVYSGLMVNSKWAEKGEFHYSTNVITQKLQYMFFVIWFAVCCWNMTLNVSERNRHLYCENK